MRRLVLASLAAALIPGGIALSLALVALSRLRTPNRVTMVEVRTPRVTFYQFVPAKQWHGRA